MAITQDRIRTELHTNARAVEETLPSPRDEEPRSLRTWMEGRISPAWAFAIATSWVGFWVALFALEPAPAPGGVLPAWFVALEVVWSIAMLGAVIGGTTAVVLRHRSALLLSLAASLFAVIGTAMCPVSSHHTPGLWTVGQFALCAGMAAISVAAIRRA